MSVNVSMNVKRVVYRGEWVNQYVCAELGEEEIMVESVSSRVSGRSYLSLIQ